MVLGELDAAFDKLAAVDIDTLTHPELLAVLDRLETQRRRHPAVEHKLIARLAAEALYTPRRSRPADSSGSPSGTPRAVPRCCAAVTLLVRR